MDRIIINVGQQLDGDTFRLHPRSKAELLKRFPGRSLPTTSIFTSYETKYNLESMYGSVLRHVAMVLTGFSEDQLEELGGFVVTDPVSGEKLFDSAGQNV